ncbi:SurA N-terminal domain-containing protein [Qipengyuania nanhaisediminis]|uniref:peptidylprolyl isomerase n=1 Tax=Qipengyuania nanhaisediminis TaxID=604088 RepID=UPI0038B34888
MISLFRNFFQSKIGLPIFIGFLVIVALAFAASDISGSATFGGLTGDDKLAVVGDEAITGNEMNSSMQNALSEARQQNPTITMPQFIAQGGLEAELDRMIDRYATGIFAREHGLRAGDNLINSEILKIQAFRNLTGDFDQATYQAALRREGITDAILRRDIGDGLLAQQLLRPALSAPQMPEAAARQYSALVLERREGKIGMIPATAFAPEGDPGAETLNTFYSENRSDFLRPERRTIRFARFGAGEAGVGEAPTDAAIAARYERDTQLYAASERRAISSFVVPTQAAANALVERIRAGTSLEAAAREAGFNVSTGELRDQATLAQATSAAFAERVFAAREGAIVEPARSSLGWYVARVDDVESNAARSLDQVRDEIAAQLREEARAGALIEMSSRIEEMVDTGTSLSDVAAEYGLEITAVSEVLASGQIYGRPGASVPDDLRPLLSTAFQMDESEPQLAEIVPGAEFAIFDVSDIEEAAAPPLGEVRAEVVAAWRRSEGNRRAGEAAAEILEAVEGGKDLATAMREANPALTQVENVNLRRAELLSGQQRVPAPLVLLFSMATGSTKILEDAGEFGWYVVDLESIETDPIEDNPEVLAQTRSQLAPALTGEYAAQLTRAIREEVGVERNEDAIEALRRTLAGES